MSQVYVELDLDKGILEAILLHWDDQTYYKELDY